MLMHVNNRQSFNRILRRFMYGREMEESLAQMGCGWFDGGCHSCAKGISLYLIASATLDPATISFKVIADRRHWANHVVVSVNVGDQTWYLDADGISSSQRLLQHLNRAEGLDGARISDFWNTQEVERSIPSSNGIALTLADKLLSSFGPFSPSWLESDDVPFITEELKSYSVHELDTSRQMVLRKVGPFPKSLADHIAHMLNSMPTTEGHHYSVRPNA